MIAGKSLPDLARVITEQRASSRDFIGNTRFMRFDDETRLILKQSGTEDVAVNLNDLAHDQIAERVKIPAVYYKRMRAEDPALLATNVNAWFDNTPANRLLRTFNVEDSFTGRAFLSDRYRALDNYDVAEHLLPVISDKGLDILSSEITERRLYIQARTTKIEGEVKKGDVVQAGLVISNSEVGCGSLDISLLIYRLVCTNGMIAGSVMRKTHTGKRHGAGDIDFASDTFTDETRVATDKAFWLQARDAVNAAISRENFNEVLERMRNASRVDIGDPIKAIEMVSDRFSMTKPETSSVLQHLIRGADLSQWGLANAVTRTAQDLPDYDRAIDFERMGSAVIELPRVAFDVSRN